MTEDNDPQDAKIDRLREENQQLQEENQQLREDNQDLKNEVQRLQRKITDLEDLVKQLKTTPQHLAADETTAEAGGIPSSHTFYKKNRNPDNTPTGAQPGHEGHAKDTPNAQRPTPLPSGWSWRPARTAGTRSTSPATG
jgi:cell division septum initiation protein DivIVA